MANLAATPSKRQTTLSFVGLTVVFFFIGSARLRGGIFRIPPDPGFDILRQARPVTRFSFFDISGSYLSITPRIISKIAAFFPVDFSAVIATVSTLTIWSITASICTMLVYKHTSSLITASICGFFCIANPAAGESSIGNYGNAIWQLFVVAVLIYSSAEFIRKHTIAVSAFSIVLGLSHPWAIIALIPLLGTFVSSSPTDRQNTKVVIWFVITSFAAQVMVFIGTGDSATRTGVTYWWQDMPLFWSFNLLFPPLLMLLVIVLAAFSQPRFAPHRQLPFQISAVGIAVAAICYLQGGIADRYFVAPMTLAICSLGVLYGQSTGRLRTLTRLVFVCSVLIVGVGSSKWFTASSYLNSGPTWHSEIERLRTVCETNNLDEIEAQLSIGAAELQCSDL
jgi:hypothetical protein